MGAAQPGGVSSAALVAARNLRVDHFTARVLRAFERTGVASILLKGPVTARWLFPEGRRSYRDCDLLVSPTGLEDAERVLSDLGFVPELEQGRMPTWWREHAVGWHNRDENATVDLHRTLTGVGVEDARLWEVLSADTEMMVVGGFPATVPSLPGRALNLALHAAQHAGDQSDLRRALVRTGEETWEEAARMAADLEATAAFAAGLRLAPRGVALAAAMGLPLERSPGVALRATAAPAEALTFALLAEAAGTRERIAIVRHKLLPPPTFMRHWSGLARRGRAGLLLAYGQRLMWVARTTPTAVRGWRASRRARRTA